MLRERPGPDPSRRGAAYAALPFVLLLAVAAAVWIVRTGPGWLVGAGLGGILVVTMGWVFISVLWPARADRECPACGAEAVVRVASDALMGRRCTACGWRDDSESAWMIAEEEGEPLEPLVMRQRGRAVDSGGAPD